MKTTEIFEQLKRKNIRVPEDLAVIQTSSGKFVGFFPYSKKTAELITKEAKNATRKMAVEIEKYLTEKQAVKESKLLKF